ncbi:hypothetical protein G6F56_004095 [Rhizopus delemar]|uniref:Retrotransposon gag domain-containing protein n=1 Tax=Rhizopus stolonifer TaxID=4846 RepID=A0A367K755_RHIST|nr:hypothetical protein G6F56_004095 [Rhizopus delemar]RCH98054.1 hypothetical protein CU098_007215 [Rhizopus stolonifer]
MSNSINKPINNFVDRISEIESRIQIDLGKITQLEQEIIQADSAKEIQRLRHFLVARQEVVNQLYEERDLLKAGKEEAGQWSINRSRLPLFQWYNSDGDDVVVEKSQTMFGSPAEALEYFEWAIKPPAADENYLDEVWAYYVEDCMGSEQLSWYRRIFVVSVGGVTGVAWMTFKNAFLDRYSQMYEPLRKLLEYTHIRMDPLRETIDDYIRRFQTTRTSAKQADDKMSAALFIESLPEAIKRKAKDIIKVDPEVDFLVLCGTAESLARHAADCVSTGKEVISQPYVCKFFKEKNIHSMSRPVPESQPEPSGHKRIRDTDYRSEFSSWTRSRDTDHYESRKSGKLRGISPNSANGRSMSRRGYKNVKNNRGGSSTTHYAREDHYGHNPSIYHNDKHGENEEELKRKMEEYRSLVNELENKISS